MRENICDTTVIPLYLWYHCICDTTVSVIPLYLWYHCICDSTSWQPLLIQVFIDSFSSSSTSEQYNVQKNFMQHLRSLNGDVFRSILKCVFFLETLPCMYFHMAEWCTHLLHQISTFSDLTYDRDLYDRQIIEGIISVGGHFL